jgi:hypothetical protein
MRGIDSAHPRGQEPNWFARRHLIKPVLFVALGWLLAVLAFAAPASPQAFKRDNGHCVTVDEAGKPRSPVTIPVPACWNFAAGAAMRETADDYPEQRPFLDGWDFRINLPQVRFQLASPGAGSGPTIAGVIEATESAESPDGTLLPSEGGYGHRNNSLWLFRTRAAQRRAFFKLLPSRRSYGSATTTNVRSLTSGWVRVGPAASPTLAVERPSVAVLGEGVPGTTVYVVARDADGELHFTRHAVTSLAPAWPDRWRRLGFRAAPRPSLSAAHDGRLVLAWTDPSTSRVRAALYTPSSDSWSAAVDVGGPAAGAPQAVWDGATLHVLFVDAATRRLRDTVAVSPLVFREPADASQIAVRGDRFDAIPFNGRIHAAFAQDGPGAATSLWYAASVSPPGFPAFWAAPSPVGFSTIGDPEIVSLYENLLVIGTRLGGRVQFARKDPNATEETTPGGSVWLSPSATVDSSIAGAFRDLDALSFNGDAYLAAAKTPSAADPRGAYLVNVGRRAMKQLITGKWGITLMWGAAGTVIDKGGFALRSQIPSVGDFDGDGKRDAVRFTQAREGTMPAPVYVARSTGSDLEQDPTPWHSSSP